MFRPNQTALWSKQIGRDIHSREIFDEPRSIPIAVVELQRKVARTTVRADSSASRGAAEETVAVTKILIDKMVEVSRDDRIELRGDLFRVVVTHPRFSVWGELDHFEVDLQAAPQ